MRWARRTELTPEAAGSGGRAQQVLRPARPPARPRGPHTWTSAARWPWWQKQPPLGVRARGRGPGVAAGAAHRAGRVPWVTCPAGPPGPSRPLSEGLPRGPHPDLTCPSSSVWEVLDILGPGCPCGPRPKAPRG